jgi:hypothetical protein
MIRPQIMKEEAKTVLPKNLRQIIILFICLFSLLSLFPVYADSFNDIAMGFLYTSYSDNTWSYFHDLSASSYDNTGIARPYISTAASHTNYYDGFGRGYVVFDTRTLEEGDYDLTLCLHTGNTIQDYIVDNWFLYISNVNAANPSDPSTEDYDQFSNDNVYALSWEWSPNSWRNESISNININFGGYTVLGLRHQSDFADVMPGYVNDLSDYIDFNDFVLITEPATTTPTPTQTPYSGNISVNLIEKYSNAALVSQAITLTPTTGGAGQTKTSLYGETLHFGVVPGMEYWFNASRAGYQDYNETYTIPSSPGIYNVYMERILPPIANHSYAHFSVVDQTNGGLIPNAEIRLSDGQTKLTNSAGYAWFSVNNSEQINYYVSKPSGYWPAYGAMNLTADESILVALQRYTGPTATATMPGWTPVTVPTTGTGSGPVVTLSAQLREQNVQEGMDVWYTNLPFISQFLFLLFIIGGLGLMAGGTRRN